MKIVQLEHLSVSEEKQNALLQSLKDQGHEVVYYKDYSSDPEVQAKRAEGADVLIIANHKLASEAVNDSVKMISVAFVGYDHVDTDKCKAQGVKISNTGGYCTDAVAELAIALSIDALRNITRGDAAVKNGLGKAGLQGFELRGKKVGIVGTGAIGLRTAELFKAFGCTVAGYSRTKKDCIEQVSLDELMSTCDIISVHTPLNKETKGLIGEKEIGLMKQGAILVNTARGPVVDTSAVAAACKAGKITYATDVYEADPPLPSDHPFLDSPNLICTPHVGFDTKESIERRADMAFENVEAFLNGKEVRRVL